MSFVIYGATGFTGTLIAEEAVRRGHRPLLAGRSAGKLAPLAARLSLPFTAVSLDDAAGLRARLAGHGAVIHAAGPFVRTSRPMLDACLDAGVSYLDITGELGVFREAFARDEAARARRIAVLPGVGFDVVPTDCLALHVARKVPDARSLELAIAAIGSPSAGTTKSALLGAPYGGFVRRDGRLRPLALGRGARVVRFADRERPALPIPWGDLETAARTTGIPDITTLAALGPGLVRGLSWLWPLLAGSRPLWGRVLARPGVQRRLEARIEREVHGPDADERARGRCQVFARAEGPSGAAEAWLETAEGYEFTARAAVRIVERVLAERPTGALTPAGAFGEDLVLEIPGTRRLDTLPGPPPPGEPR